MKIEAVRVWGQVLKEQGYDVPDGFCRVLQERDYYKIMRVVRAAEKYSSNHTNEGLYDLQDALSALARKDRPRSGRKGKVKR